ncbi:hypothetical protein [Glutamicibacter halophytocola]|uniref:hypothetical protein n=1 Tax=Glutamicibacter halophytocola TaxID=1933880 RepID=UPI0015C5461E|nr:hypothetical protein [Glutamicibacter halophytocola]NQD42708.1 hypothetical protein [Glutamicibacter halophytocola]
MALPLPTDVTIDTAGHADLHNDVNTEVNRLGQDTGRRDVKSLLINGWTAASVEIQRSNGRCYLRIGALNGSSATSSRFMDMPAGFQPPYIVETYAQRDSSSAFVQGVTLSLSGGFTIPSGTVLGSAVREVSWACTAGWPSSLPGTAI